VKHARIPANSAEPSSARNGGTFLSVKATSRKSGSSATTEIVKSCSSTSRTAWVLTVDSGVAVSPSTRKATRLIPSAGPAVQNMLRMCLPVVSPPPTSCGTRIVVSESGVILSPKYAPQITAPAATCAGSPITLAIPTNATPSVPAVVHELPVTSPTIAQIAAVVK
jgi:hypothetical protein